MPSRSEPEYLRMQPWEQWLLWALATAAFVVTLYLW